MTVKVLITGTLNRALRGNALASRRIGAETASARAIASCHFASSANCSRFAFFIAKVARRARFRTWRAPYGASWKPVSIRALLGLFKCNVRLYSNLTMRRWSSTNNFRRCGAEVAQCP